MPKFYLTYQWENQQDVKVGYGNQYMYEGDCWMKIANLDSKLANVLQGNTIIITGDIFIFHINYLHLYHIKSIVSYQLLANSKSKLHSFRTGVSKLRPQCQIYFVSCFQK